MANADSPVLVQRPSLTDIQTPFEGDLLERAALAQRLTAYLQRLQIGAVLAIDAPWGEGKTWFGRHWAKSLENEGHRVAFIDAFGQDYAEDAFMVLSAAILRLCADDATTTEDVKRRAGEVMRALLPAATKAVIHLAATAMGAGAVVSAFKEFTAIEVEADEFASAAKQAGDKAGDVTSAWVERRLGQWEAEQKSVEGFRQILTEFAAKRFEETEKPVVIVVDELDRCRPAFAVALLERIKHFFDVPHLVFVLLMNRDQLEKAIRGVYGAETDAAAYLGKFLHLSLRLRKDRQLDHLSAEYHGTYMFAKDTLGKIGITDELFIHPFATCAAIFNLSLREIERGCTLFALSDMRQPGLRAYLIALKLKSPGQYADLVEVDHAASAHQACWERLARAGDALVALQDRAPAGGIQDLPFPADYIEGLMEFHRSFGAGPSTDVDHPMGYSEETAKRRLIEVVGRSPRKELHRALRALDLDVT